MTVKLTRFNIQDHIKTPERQAGLMEAILEDGTPDDIAVAIGEIARARSAAAFARESGISRETIYKQFREGGDPRLATLAKALNSLGMRISAVNKA